MKRNWKKNGSCAGLVLFLLLSFAGCGRGIGKEVWSRETQTEVYAEGSPFSEAKEAAPDGGFVNREEEETDFILVHVCGEVAVPGVYALEAGSRVCDALEAAGGATENGAADYLNLARTVKDGEQIRVPDLAEAAAGGYDESADTEEGPVNLNTADADKLMTLPGIGQAKAEAILAYREENGLFSSAEEIKQVSGIGDAIYEKLKEFITV